MYNGKSLWHRRAEKDGMDPFQKALFILFLMFLTLFLMSEFNIPKIKMLLSNEAKSTEHIVGQSGKSLQDQSPPFDLNDIEETPEAPSEPDKVNDILILNSEAFDDLRLVQAKIESYLREKDIMDIVGTKLTAKGLHVLLYTDTIFEAGDAKLEKEGHLLIEEIANYITVDEAYDLIVTGYADDLIPGHGTLESNWELSAMRSMQVMHILTETMNLKKAQFSARARGDKDPIIAKATKANEHLNRRVEIIVQPRI